MPSRKRRRVPSYRLHKPSCLAVVRLSGRDFYLGPYDTLESRQEYDRIVAEWLTNGHQSPGKAQRGCERTEPRTARKPEESDDPQPSQASSQDESEKSPWGAVHNGKLRPRNCDGV